MVNTQKAQCPYRYVNYNSLTSTTIRFPGPNMFNLLTAINV